jgi:hypothetical protein
MNHLTRSLLAGLLVIGTPAISLHAQAPAPAPGDPFVKDAAAADAKKKDQPWENCLAILEVYALDKQEAFSVLESETGGAARYRKVIELSKAGKARFEILTAITSKSGQRVLAGSIDGVRYPTEFEPPTVKDGIAAPTAWETRDTGDTFELEVVINPEDQERGCSANLVPQRVSLKGFQDIGGMAKDSLISQPLFATQKITTSVQLRASEAFYLGTMTPPTGRGAVNGQAASETWLAFLRMHLVSPKAEDLKPKAKSDSATSLNLEYSFFSMDRADARELLVASTALDTPWEKLQALLSSKKATLEHISTVNTVPGQRCVTEEIEETRFASEYSPESIRPSSSETTSRTVTAHAAGAKKDDEASTNESVTTTHTEANGERQPGGATAFETRNAGVTIEIEPVIGPDLVTVDINQAIHSVTNLGNLQVTGVAKQYPPSILFEDRNVTNSQATLLGRHSLIGTLNPPGPNGVNGRQETGRTWLVFVRPTSEP